jgi:hypothetical protein
MAVPFVVRYQRRELGDSPQNSENLAADQSNLAQVQ